MSVAGGMHRAVERALAVDATALQVFAKSARQWKAAPLRRDEARRFREALEAAGLGGHTMAHASYLINLASPRPAVRERSIAALRSELRRCATLAVPYLVVHPGSHVGAGEAAGLRRVVRALDRVLATEVDVMLLLELTAGQGSNLGCRFDHMRWILERVRAPERIGICFDTCHALAAGYDFRDRRSYRRTFAELDRSIGLERLRGFHLNDSKHGLGSRRDRHEHIGRGAVGLAGFRLILNDARFRTTPMVLETPKGVELAEDRRNLRVLRGLLPPARR